MLAVSDYGTVAIQTLVVLGMAGSILLLTHLIGPSRHGARKESTYESGVEPIGDTRRRFNVRFYLVAVLFLVFDVEIIFLYPWAILFPRMVSPGEGSTDAALAAALSSAGYGPGFLFWSIMLFFALLTVGFIYEWRKGVFRWD